MNLQPTLADELVLLRPLVAEDFNELYAVASDPLIWEQHPAHNRWQRPVFELFFAHALAMESAFAVIDQQTQQMIGSTRYRLAEKHPGAVEIGWTFLARTHWGGTYNRAMKVLLIEHAFQYVNQVLLLIGNDNVRSCKAAEKMGAKRLPDEIAAPLVIGKDNYCAYAFQRSRWGQ
ncbi:MAG: GNAT family N-acetyltransferase [Bacteroidota bacterium]